MDAAEVGAVIYLLLFAFDVVGMAIVGALVRRLYRELDGLRAEVQALRDQLDERDQVLEPCIGFVFEQSDEYELGVCRKGRR